MAQWAVSRSHAHRARSPALHCAQRGRTLQAGSGSSMDLYASMTTRTRCPAPAAGQRGITTTYLPVHSMLGAG